MRRVTGLAAGAVLAATGLVLAACQQGGGSAAGTGGSTAETTVETSAAGPNQAVAAAYQTTADARTAKLAMATQVGIGATQLPVTANGVLDFAHRSADLTEHLPGKGATAETRFVNGMLYEQVPQLKQLTGGKPWASIDLSKLSAHGNAQQLMSDTPADPTAFLGYLRGVGAQVTTVGPDTVDGTATTHYKVTIDLDKAAAGQSAGAQQGVRTLEQEIGSHTLPADVWIDNQGRLRKFSMRETLNGPPQTGTTSATPSTKPAGKVSVAVTATLSDFGVPVTVTAPPADQTADLTNKLAGH
ncbi:MAG TPA: hypothetical protein VHF06_01595 [Pseudonocardiaceae bacterium]|jgi:hypothetical protein|nr:hypothetical protein [Pseudonocardiaceae bacterium]